MTEIWDIYDSGRGRTGKTHARREALAPGDYILVAMVLIFNTRGEMLIQQRAEHLKWAPGKWTMTAGGAAVAGETTAAAASRELFEELGIKADFAGIRPHFSITYGDAFMDYFLLTRDVDLAGLKLPTEEVRAVKWVTKDEMIGMAARGDCVPYRKSFLEFCFDGGVNMM